LYKRILGLDVGDKWIGSAHTDLTQVIVFPYKTWSINNFDNELAIYLKQNNLECIVVGLPITMNGNISEQTKKIIQWIEQKKIKFPQIIFYTQDERLSSSFAKKIIATNKNKKNSDHSISASIILENFLLSYKK
jgi:putative Holliday junction resolvase